MHARPMMNRCTTCGQEWWDAHACPKQVLKDGRTLAELVSATKIVSDGVWADDAWPKLTKPARVGNGTFGVGVSSRLVVDAAQRQHEYAQQEERLTDEQAREHERNRRRLWDMLNGPVVHTDMKEAIEQAVQAERHACSIAVWMTLQDALADDADDKGLEGWMREAEARVKARA